MGYSLKDRNVLVTAGSRYVTLGLPRVPLIGQLLIPLRNK